MPPHAVQGGGEGPRRPGEHRPAHQRGHEPVPRRLEVGHPERLEERHLGERSTGQVEVQVLPGRRVTADAQVVAHRAGAAGEPGPEHRLDRAGEEVVADHHREVLAELPLAENPVQRGAAAAALGPVGHVVVDQQEGVQELEGGGEGPEAVGHLAVAGAHPVADRHQGRPQSLAGPQRVLPGADQRLAPAWVDALLVRKLQQLRQPPLDVGLEMP